MEQIEIRNPATGQTATVSAKAYEAVYRNQGFVAPDGYQPEERPPSSIGPVANPNTPTVEDYVGGSAGRGAEAEGEDAPKAPQKRRSTGHPADPIKPEPEE